jgi:two-component system chemotaxis sensor kinase CheA
VRQRLEWIHNTPVYRLRGQLLPLVYLAQELGGRQNTAEDVLNIAVLRADDRQFGLVVDHVRDTAEIVVKPLGKQLKDIPVFAGATILGDGKVALILDVLGLAQRACVLPEGRERTRPDPVSPPAPALAGRESLVLLELGQRRLALPLAQAARLEKIPHAALERTGDRTVVQYRERILPLIHLSRLLPDLANDQSPQEDPLNVVVYSDQEHSVGLVVHKVLDIVETIADSHSPTPGPGIRGTVVIQGRVTDVLDMRSVLRLAEVGGKA